MPASPPTAMLGGENTKPFTSELWARSAHADPGPSTAPCTMSVQIKTCLGLLLKSSHKKSSGFVQSGLS